MFTATYLIDMAALCCFMGMLFSNTALNKERKTPFAAAIALTLVVIISEAGTVLASQEQANLRGLHIFFNVLGFSLTPVIPLAMALIFDRALLVKHKIVLVPALVNLAAAVLSPKYGIIFAIDASNGYARGRGFSVFVAVYMINLLFLIFTTLDVGRKSNYPILGKMVALSVFAMVGTGIQLLYPSAHTAWHCVTLSLLLYFLLMAEFDSSFDALTTLYNRAAFDQAVKRMERGGSFSVIMLDIDHFKAVNDTYGHDYGDDVIKTVASIVRSSFNEQYTCYRIGGDDFSIIGKETEPSKIEEQLRTMTANVAAATVGNRCCPLPTVSYGYSVFSGREKPDFTALLKEADGQMYQHKKKVQRDDC